MPARLAACAALCVCVSLGACGGGSATGHASQKAPSSTPGLAKAGYTHAADAICARYNTQIDAVPHGNDPASRAAGKEAIVGLLRREITELQALRPPPPDASQLATIYAGAKQALASGQPSALDPWGAKLAAYGIKC